jgi:hypothetical protein
MVFIVFYPLNAQTDLISKDTMLHSYSDVSKIDTSKHEIYYAFDNYDIGSAYWTTDTQTVVVGEVAYFQVFTAQPFYSSIQEKNKNPCFTREDTLMMYMNGDYSYREVRSKNMKNCMFTIYAWVCDSYERAIDQRLSNEIKDKIKRDFLRDIEYNQNRNNQKIYYCQRIYDGYEYMGFLKAIKEKHPVVFQRKYTPFDK